MPMFIKCKSVLENIPAVRFLLLQYVFMKLGEFVYFVASLVHLYLSRYVWQYWSTNSLLFKVGFRCQESKGLVIMPSETYSVYQQINIKLLLL